MINHRSATLITHKCSHSDAAAATASSAAAVEFLQSQPQLLNHLLRTNQNNNNVRSGILIEQTRMVIMNICNALAWTYRTRDGALRDTRVLVTAAGQCREVAIVSIIVINFSNNSVHACINDLKDIRCT